MQVRSLSREDPLEEGMAAHSSILAWRIASRQRSLAGYSPWGRKELDTTEVPGHACTHVCLYVYSFFPILFHYSLFQYIEYSSMCYRENPCCLLYMWQCASFNPIHPIYASHPSIR